MHPQELARRIESRRIQVFGSKIAAYRAAGLAPPTWDRIEAGEPVRPDRLAAAVRVLWPETQGDYRLIETAEDELPHRSARIPDPEPPVRRDLSSCSDTELVSELLARLRQRA